MKHEFDCPICKGEGYVEVLDGRTWGGDEITHIETCSRCDGEKQIDIAEFDEKELIELAIDQDRQLKAFYKRLYAKAEAQNEI